ncbi:hypothetical protein [Absidia glauca]|uniref:Ndc10 domain-containing protein n=1 Tax=Absidia glauca TaxID=4829 RepID=A0A168PB89_ABSGL|nr:hypothetical protein [Absidia glauca]
MTELLAVVMLLSSDSCLLQRSLVHVSTYQERGQTLAIKKLVSAGKAADVQPSFTFVQPLNTLVMSITQMHESRETISLA